jgi:hypothetical protein
MHLSLITYPSAVLGALTLDLTWHHDPWPLRGLPLSWHPGYTLREDKHRCQSAIYKLTAHTRPKMGRSSRHLRGRILLPGVPGCSSACVRPRVRPSWGGLVTQASGHIMPSSHVGIPRRRIANHCPWFKRSTSPTSRACNTDIFRIR